jgi:hypothetical protein
MHVATAMIAPLRLSGITPRLSITRTASMAILIKAQAMSRSLPFTGEYAPGRQFPARPAATIKLTHYRTFPRALAYWPVYPLVAELGIAKMSRLQNVDIALLPKPHSSGTL